MGTLHPSTIFLFNNTKGICMETHFSQILKKDKLM